ncbi:helix-turn-helix domain-containing protein [Streptomyces griseorubiginosus]|uniref:helix-turn-helix domain-containing protein n=1 Tax=Streptomyces griseorubiginosus TaxID=67304 RepID=UPI00364FAE98
MCEDDAAVRGILRCALERDGHTVSVAATADSLLRQLAPLPQLVVLDLGLPDADGRDVARRVARWMVVFLQRPCGQAQFSVRSQTDAPTTRGLRQVLDAVVLELAADHSTGAMAARAAVSERHLARMFRDEVGMAPARYVEQTRLEAAKVLLVTGDESRESVARRAGFGSPETMRRIFRRNLGVPPGSCRSRFRRTGVDDGAGVRLRHRIPGARQFQNRGDAGGPSDVPVAVQSPARISPLS